MYQRTSRNSRQRIRSEFARVSLLNINLNYTNDRNQLLHPFYSGTFDDGEDPFTPILISHNSGSTVCSGITMDEALTDSAPLLSHGPQHEPLDEPLQHEPPGSKRSLLQLLEEFNQEEDEYSQILMSTIRSMGLSDELDDPPIPPSGSIRHINLASAGNAFMTKPHNIQNDSSSSSAVRRSCASNYASASIHDNHETEGEGGEGYNYMEGDNYTEEYPYDEETEVQDVEMDDLGWGGIKDVKPSVKLSVTGSTVESEEEEGEEDNHGDEDHQNQSKQGFRSHTTSSAVASLASSQQHVSNHVEEFDTEHAIKLEDPTYDDAKDKDDDTGKGQCHGDIHQSEGKQGSPIHIGTSPAASLISSQRSVSIRLEDFDMDHLTILEDFIYDNACDEDADSCGEGEASLVRKLETNASELYWLQLTKTLKDSSRLATAMKGNTSVRNVTVYPSSIEKLPYSEQKSLADALCQLKNLRSLIVFHDCGSLFVDPVIRYRPPLTRLTLYKLDISGDQLLCKLVMLLVGLRGLEDLALEKYKGDDGCRFMKAVAKCLPSMKRLKSLIMTPARGIKLTRDGPHDLFSALGKNKTVRTLSLQGSADFIDQSAITELGNALRANKVLEEVKLTGFWKSEDAFWKRFTEKSKKRIDYFLGLNKAGIRNLQLDVNADFETLKNAILTHKDNLDHVFYLLLHNPSLLVK